MAGSVTQVVRVTVSKTGSPHKVNAGSTPAVATNQNRLYEI
jgi:hypothetical protein